MERKLLARLLLLLLCGSSLAGCSFFSKDTTPPIILNTTPSANEFGVLVDQTLIITFNEDIEVGSFHARLLSGSEEIPLGAASGTKSVLITPLRPLDFGTSYKLVVDPGVSDLSGNVLSASYELSFATGTKNAGFIKGSVIVDSFAKRVWNGLVFSPQQKLLDSGMTLARVGVTTVSSPELAGTPATAWSEATTPWQDSFWSSREMAGQILLEAKNAGCAKLDAFLFLSDKAATADVYTTQMAPTDWSTLSIPDLQAAVRQNAKDTATYFSSLGLNIDVYEIGNEIEFGVLGYTTGSGKIPIPPGTDILRDAGWMESNVWSIEAGFLKAAIQGIRDAGSSAKIGLHIAGLGYSSNNDFAYRFFNYMKTNDVAYDIAELSYPYMFGNGPVAQPYFRQTEFTQIIDRLKDLGKEVYIAEFSYPAYPEGITNPPSSLYPFTEAGQSDFIEDFLRVAQSHADGAFYFYPDYYPDQAVYGSGTINLQSSGLFKDGNTADANTGLAKFL